MVLMVMVMIVDHKFRKSFMFPKFLLLYNISPHYKCQIYLIYSLHHVFGLEYLNKHHHPPATSAPHTHTHKCISRKTNLTHMAHMKTIMQEHKPCTGLWCRMWTWTLVNTFTHEIRKKVSDGSIDTYNIQSSHNATEHTYYTISNSSCYFCICTLNCQNEKRHVFLQGDTHYRSQLIIFYLNYFTYNLYEPW